MPTPALLTQEVLRLEVLSEALEVGIVVLPPTQSLAHVAPLVDGAQVVEEGVVVEETVVTELAERVALVGGVLGVPVPAVGDQVVAGVSLLLAGE